METSYIADNNHIKFTKQLENVCNEQYNKDAITYLLDNASKESIKFGELFNSIQTIRKMLGEVGLKPGDRVGVIAPSMPNTFITCLSLAYSNITAVIIDSYLPKEESLRLIFNSDVKCIFTIETIYNSINQMLKNEIPIFDIGNSLGKISLFKTSINKTQVENTIDCQYDVIAILYSSGTTSSMKGVMITYQSIMESRELLSEIFGVKEGMTYLSVLPLYHIAGFDSSIMFLLSGCGIGMIENVNASKLHKGLLEYNPHYFGMVPKVYDIMAEKIILSIKEKGGFIEFVVNNLLNFCGFVRKHWNIKLGQIIFKPLYKKIFGNNIWGLATMGTVCKEDTAKLFINMGIEWANVYASTETNAPITSTGIYDYYAVNSVGKVNRHKNIEIRIKEQNELGIGEVQVKSSLIMKGYFKDAELTGESFEDGYFKTGDLGYIDKDDNLFITGRIKETIILHNGEKISVNDIDSYYGKICPSVLIASCGIKTDKDFEEVHLFIEQGKLSLKEVEKYKDELQQKSSYEKSNYRLAAIHIVENIPVTSVGKVKRYLLKDMIMKNEVIGKANYEVEDNTVQNIVLKAVNKIYSGDISIKITSKLREDLGFDSLNLFELCTEIETKLNVNIAQTLQNIVTVEDVINASGKTNNSIIMSKRYNILDFPKEKTDKDIRFLKRFKSITERIWNLKVVNAESLLERNKYILCPNHESYFDALWVVTALQKADVDVRPFYCMAAEHLMYKRRWIKEAFFALGSIPVDRTGDSVLATERALSCLNREKCILLIHPEGTRSRSGKLGEFKLGAAKLAIEADVDIIPICIKGAYEIYPPTKRFPKLLGKKEIEIEFGQPINSKEKNEVDITQEMRKQIESMKGI